MHFIGSGHIPLEHTEMLQEFSDLILAILILPLSYYRSSWPLDYHRTDIKRAGLSTGTSSPSHGETTRCVCQQHNPKMRLFELSSEHQNTCLFPAQALLYCGRVSSVICNCTEDELCSFHRKYSITVLHGWALARFYSSHIIKYPPTPCLA